MTKADKEQVETQRKRIYELEDAVNNLLNALDRQCMTRDGVRWFSSARVNAAIQRCRELVPEVFKTDEVDLMQSEQESA